MKKIQITLVSGETLEIENYQGHASDSIAGCKIHSYTRPIENIVIGVGACDNRVVILRWRLLYGEFHYHKEFIIHSS